MSERGIHRLSNVDNQNAQVITSLDENIHTVESSVTFVDNCVILTQWSSSFVGQTLVEFTQLTSNQTA